MCRPPAARVIVTSRLLARRGRRHNERLATDHMSLDLDTALNAAKVVDRWPEDISERYEIGEMLGEGRFSQVFAALEARTTMRSRPSTWDSRGGRGGGGGTRWRDDCARDAHTPPAGGTYPSCTRQQTPDTLYVVMDQVLQLRCSIRGRSPSRRTSDTAQLLSALHGLHRQESCTGTSGPRT